MIRRILPLVAAAFVTIILAGCLDADETFVINPDGSGKVSVESTVEQMDMGFSDDSKKVSAKEAVNKFVAETVNGSSGVEVWKDVVCKRLADGKMYFKGTAYFKDIAEVDLKNVSTSRFGVERSAGGEVTYYLGGDPSAKSETDETKAPVQMTDEELNAKADSMKQNTEMGLSMMRPFFNGMRVHTVLRSAGTFKSAAGFDHAADGSTSILFSGQRMMTLVDSLTSLPNYWKDAVRAEASGQTDARNQEMRKMMFGTDKPGATYQVEGAKPLFDYAAEVRAARKGYAALLKKYAVKEK
ncbi:MAG TPA: hypothetical protein VHI13_21145 [Candidatus Kapabacteria bacterium]|nr:hypothetical protein [Candidatus Kapabacteria bacterium]